MRQPDRMENSTRVFGIFDIRSYLIEYVIMLSVNFRRPKLFLCVTLTPGTHSTSSRFELVGGAVVKLD